MDIFKHILPSFPSKIYIMDILKAYFLVETFHESRPAKAMKKVEAKEAKNQNKDHLFIKFALYIHFGSLDFSPAR